MPEELLEEDAGGVRMGSVAEEEADDLPEIPEEVGVKEVGEGGEGEVSPYLPHLLYTCSTSVAPFAPLRTPPHPSARLLAPPRPSLPLVGTHLTSDDTARSPLALHPCLCPPPCYEGAFG